LTRNHEEEFTAIFHEGNVQLATEYLARWGVKVHTSNYQAHPLIRAFVASNRGHCYRRPHLLIADLLTPEPVRRFRDQLLKDNVPAVGDMLREDAALAHAQFTGGRGIAQAIHHWRSVEVGSLLVSAGSDINSVTNLGESPLTMQVRYGSVEGVKFLLDSGVNPNIGGGFHMRSRDMVDIIELLVSHGWIVDDQLMLHDANHGYGTRVQLWLKYGADPNAKNRDGRTALHLFAVSGKGRDVIRSLVNAGAEVNVRDAHGLTPLQLARSAPWKSAREVLQELTRS